MDLLFTAGSSPSAARKLQRRFRAGELRRLVAGVFVAGETDEEVARVVRMNWQSLCAHLAPGAVVSHASALEGGLIGAGVVVLSHPTIFNKRRVFPGLTVVLRKGPGLLPGDMPLGTLALSVASRPRALLENIGRQAEFRAPPERLAQALADELHIGGSEALRDLLESATEIAPALGMQAELAELCRLAEALLPARDARAAGESARPARAAASSAGGAAPVDDDLIARLETLASYLRTSPLPRLVDQRGPGAVRVRLAILESYFSNLVEGVRFEAHEAEAIFLKQPVPPGRDADAADLRAVFRMATAVTCPDSSYQKFL